MSWLRRIDFGVEFFLAKTTILCLHWYLFLKARMLISEQNALSVIFDCVLKQARTHRNGMMLNVIFRYLSSHQIRLFCSFQKIQTNWLFNRQRCIWISADRYYAYQIWSKIVSNLFRVEKSISIILRYLLTVPPEKSEDWSPELRINFLHGFDRLLDFLSIMHVILILVYFLFIFRILLYFISQVHERKWKKTRRSSRIRIGMGNGIQHSNEHRSYNIPNTTLGGFRRLFQVSSLVLKFVLINFSFSP